MTETIQITPNVVVPDADVRRRIGVVLWLLSLLAGVASLFFLFFPEVAAGTDIPTRAVAFVNALVSLGTGSFGFAVTLPNTPRKSDTIETLESAIVVESEPANRPDSFDVGPGAHG